MHTPHISCYTTDNDIPSHTLPLLCFLRSFPLERLHIAKTLNNITYPALPPPPVSIHTLRLPHSSPSSHGNPPTRITDPPPPISNGNHRPRLRLSPRWPKHTHRKQGHHHTHLSPARGRRNHVRCPPQQSTPLPQSDTTVSDHHPFSPSSWISNHHPDLPLQNSTTTVFAHHSPHFLTSLTLSLFLYSFFFLPLSLFERKGIPYWL